MPSIVELLERLVALESSVMAVENTVAARDARIGVLEAENAEFAAPVGSDTAELEHAAVGAGFG